jgi:hypothetical protein
MVKNERQGRRSKLRGSKTAAVKDRPRATFIGTRPRIFTMTLRGQAVDVEVIPAVGTTTHVNFEITISQRGKILNWVPTRAELEAIGRVAGMHSEKETSH